jgi:hypothetical protein
MRKIREIMGMGMNLLGTICKATGHKKIYTVKKGLPSPAGMLLIKLSLDGNNLIIPAQGEFDQ